MFWIFSPSDVSIPLSNKINLPSIRIRLAQSNKVFWSNIVLGVCTMRDNSLPMSTTKKATSALIILVISMRMICMVSSISQQLRVALVIS